MQRGIKKPFDGLGFCCCDIYSSLFFQCNWDACRNCMLSKQTDIVPPSPAVVPPPALLSLPVTKHTCDLHHDLVLSSFNGGGYSTGFRCNICRLGTSHGKGMERYFCNPCTYDLCKDCALAKHPVPPTLKATEKTYRHPGHSHVLRSVAGNFNCDVCKQQHLTSGRFQCKEV